MIVCPSCGFILDPAAIARSLALQRAEARRAPVQARREKIAADLRADPTLRGEALAVRYGVSLATIKGDLRALRGAP